MQGWQDSPTVINIATNCEAQFAAVKRATFARHTDRLTSHPVFVLGASDKIAEATNILLIALGAFQSIRGTSGLTLTLTPSPALVLPALSTFQ